MYVLLMSFKLKCDVSYIGKVDFKMIFGEILIIYMACIGHNKTYKKEYVER